MSAPTPPDKPIHIVANGATTDPRLSLCTVGLLLKVFGVYTTGLGLVLAASLNYLLLPRIAKAEESASKVQAHLVKLDRAQYAQQVKLDLLLDRLQVAVPASLRAEGFRPRDGGHTDGGDTD